MVRDSLLLIGEALPKFQRKAIECRFPVVDRHRPLLGYISHGQVDHLVDRLIRGKNPMIARHLPQAHIDRLNSIGGINDLANVLWESK